MRTLLENPPDVSPWNSTGMFQPPKLKKKTAASSAWSGQRLKITRGPAAPAAPEMTQEELEAGRQAARAEARAKRRAAAIAHANMGLRMLAKAGKEAADGVAADNNAGSITSGIMPNITPTLPIQVIDDLILHS
jgi:hypothetical protein